MYIYIYIYIYIFYIIISDKSIYFIERNTHWFEPIKFWYKTSSIQILFHDFSSSKVLSKSKSLSFNYVIKIRTRKIFITSFFNSVSSILYMLCINMFLL